MRIFLRVLGTASLAVIVFSLGPLRVASGEHPGLEVNCDRGETVGVALGKGQPGAPLTLVINGICNENISIARDDVTLVAGPGSATINGPDPTVATIDIAGNRVLIDGLTVQGGRNGIVAVAGKTTIQNCTVQNAVYTGIFFRQAFGLVDNCVVQNNSLTGITVEAGSATIVNSTISANGQDGILVMRAGAARIGITGRSTYAGNIISSNGTNGIQVASNSAAAIGANTISGNGFGTGRLAGQNGINGASGAYLDIVGANTITGNAGAGVAGGGGSHVTIGDTTWGLSITNIITSNGGGGVNVGFSSRLGIRAATISKNSGDGVVIWFRSVGVLTSTTTDTVTVSDNTGHGITLNLGGSLALNQPAGGPFVSVTGNNGFGLRCFGADARFSGSTTGISGNGAADVDANCLPL